jgi:uncharacterized membrane protein
MQPSPYHFLPFPLLPYLAFVALLAIAFSLVEIGIVHYTAEQLGIERRRVFLLLLLCLLGSYINIPVAQLPSEPVESGKIVTIFGVSYVVPVVREWPGTVLAVNVGGALIPAGLAIYLLLQNKFYLQGLIAVAVVALVVHGLARPVGGVGISVPTLIPPVVATAVAALLSWKKSAPLAYVAGTLGTLIGADLMNLSVLPGLGAPIASIGGAGTFDGVFLTGVLAALLA